MKPIAPFAAGFLAVGYGIILYIAAVVEPQMGFTTIPADFLDPDKVAAGYTSAAWLNSNVLYFMMPVAIWLLAGSSDDTYLRWSGVAAGLLLFVVGSIDRVGIELPSLIPDTADRRAALGALLTVRFAVLRSHLVAVGVFAWRTTRSRWGSGVLAKLWPGLGYIVLAGCIGFLFVPIPVPILLLIWATTLTVHQVKVRSGAAPGGA